jgi:hypothetical protein
MSDNDQAASSPGLGIIDYHNLVRRFLEAPGDARQPYADLIKVVTDVAYKPIRDAYTRLTSDHARELSPTALSNFSKCNVHSWDARRIAKAFVAAPDVEVKKAIAAGMLVCAAADEGTKEEALDYLQYVLAECARDDKCAGNGLYPVSDVVAEYDPFIVKYNYFRENPSRRPNIFQGFEFKADLSVSTAHYVAGTRKSDNLRVFWSGNHPVYGLRAGLSYHLPIGYTSAIGAEAAFYGGFANLPRDLETWYNGIEQQERINYILFLRPEASLIYSMRVHRDVDLRWVGGYGWERALFFKERGGKLDNYTAPPHKLHVGLEGTYADLLNFGARFGYNIPSGHGDTFYLKEWELSILVGVGTRGNNP